MQFFSGYSFRLSRPELALAGVTILWGATFLLIHTAVRYSGPLFLVGLRFLIAAVLLGFCCRRILCGITWRDVTAGSVIGIALFLGYSLQTVGLQTISSSQSAFITALYVPTVPLLQWFFWRRAPRLLHWAGAFLAFAGLVLVAGPGKAALVFSVGEAVTLLSALAIAFEIILIGYFAAGVDSRRVTIIQLFVTSLAAFATMPLAGEMLPQFSWVWLIIAFLLGVMSGLIQFVMNWAQKSVSPTRATILYAGEPVWAGIIGWLAGEQLAAMTLSGAACIVAGVLVSQFDPEKKKAAREEVRGL